MGFMFSHADTKTTVTCVRRPPQRGQHGHLSVPSLLYPPGGPRIRQRAQLNDVVQDWQVTAEPLGHGLVLNFSANRGSQAPAEFRR